MWQRIQTAVEILYPPRCMGCGDLVLSEFGLCGPCWRDTLFIEGTVCESCGVPLPGNPDGHRLDCDDCMKTPRAWSEGRSTLLYSGHARRLVLGLKHGDRPEIARPAAKWMARAGKPLLRPDMLIVPVPLYWTRLLRRRYNQSALLARELSLETGLPTCPDLLIRHRRTEMLDGKNHAERRAALSGAIAPHPRRKDRAAGRSILLIDDVMTSGATLEACARATYKAGADQVFVLTLARVAKDP